jgi:NDP-sugar pyrophosphorylase family protein
MARNLINEPFVLFESDLVLNSALLDQMVFPDKMAVALMQPWLDGTTVSVNELNQITQFHKGTTDAYFDVRYKTVNIYSFSLSSWRVIISKLNQYIFEGSVNLYYETVFSEMIDDNSLAFESVSFDHKPWYEIDTIHDLSEAEKLFPIQLKKVAKPEKVPA